MLEVKTTKPPEAYEHPDGTVRCAECGHEAEWEECDVCGGEGSFEAYEDDPLRFDPGDRRRCGECNGRGGTWWCENPKCESQDLVRVERVKQVDST